jgi:hypothetical protein
LEDLALERPHHSLAANLAIFVIGTQNQLGLGGPCLRRKLWKSVTTILVTAGSGTPARFFVSDRRSGQQIACWNNSQAWFHSMLYW